MILVAAPCVCGSDPTLAGAYVHDTAEHSNAVVKCVCGLSIEDSRTRECVIRWNHLQWALSSSEYKP